MPVITPDLSQVSSGAIEPGTYPAKIIAVEFKESKKGNPMIVPKFEVTIGEGKTRTRQAHLVVTGESAFGFEQLLRATHFDDVADSLKSAPKPFDTDQLIGQELQVVIDSDSYNGQLTDKIKTYLRK